MSDDALQAELDSVAVALESYVWVYYGHTQPTDFRDWQSSFELARQNPHDEAIRNDAEHRLDQLMH